MPSTTFITGYPGLIARRLVEHLAAASDEQRLVALVEPGQLEAARRHAAAVRGAPVDLIEGSVADMHLGLAGPEYVRLLQETRRIFHLAAVSSPSAAPELARRVNVEGTRNVLELARECPSLTRLFHLSTCAVAGTRTGVIAEDELEAGQSFRGALEETRFEAERMVQRAKATLPLTVARPAAVVGDSRTGEIDLFDGPYALGLLLLLSPPGLPLPLPGDGGAPLNVVPLDFLVDAIGVLAASPAAEGATVHLVDPHPMSVRRAFEAIAARAGRRPPRFTRSLRATDLILRLPGIDRITRLQRAALAWVDHFALYDCSAALQLLEASSVRCPPLATYLDRLTDYALAAWRGRRSSPPDTEIDDPLDPPLR